MPKVTLPSIDQLQATNQKFNLGCTDEELLEYQDLFKGTVDDLNFVDETVLKPDVSSLNVNRDFNFPPQSENQYNAWYVRCELKGKETGKLAGKRIAIKDNICIAGVPMMNGSAVMEGYVPDDDATVVQRILNEGGTIIGKATCEDLCLSGQSFATHKGPVLNPINKEHSAGGSSSGCAVVVATQEADMAVGGDQGGSVRIPASHCGIVALKPTHGLIPYTGASPCLPALDHLGPMTKSVEDCALLLEVLAGYDDGKDYRQNPFIKVPKYSQIIYPKIPLKSPIKIGVLKEGVDVCDADVVAVFNKALDKLKCNENLKISTVRLPEHADSSKYMGVLSDIGTYGCMLDGCGFGVGVTGYQPPSFVQQMFNGIKTKGSEMDVVLKQLILFSESHHQQHGPYHYAKASSVITRLSALYTRLLEDYDVLILPTLLCLPCKIPPAEASIKDKVTSAMGISKNTGIFDGTGHPALSLNCGFSDEGKFPVGLMVVGKHWDEVTVLNAASVFESIFDL